MSTSDDEQSRLVSGEDWHIVGTLLDTGGNRLDLTNASVEWVLLDSHGAVVDPQSAGINDINV